MKAWIQATSATADDNGQILMAGIFKPDGCAGIDAACITIHPADWEFDQVPSKITAGASLRPGSAATNYPDYSFPSSSAWG